MITCYIFSHTVYPHVVTDVCGESISTSEAIANRTTEDAFTVVIVLDYGVPIVLIGYFFSIHYCYSQIYRPYWMKIPLEEDRYIKTFQRIVFIIFIEIIGGV